MAFHICLAADENYVKYAAVLMTSIVKNIDKNISFESLFDYQSNEKNAIIAPSIRAAELLKDYKKCDFNFLKEEEKEEKIIFHLLSDFIKPETQEKLKNLEKELADFYSTEIQIHILSDSVFKDFSKWEGNYLTYYRLLIPELFCNMDTVLYLDVDMLVYADLRALWALDLKGVCAGAVCDGLINSAGNKKRSAKNKEMVPFSFGDFYFNAGFLLMNLKEFREKKIKEKCLDFFNSYEVRTPDQDALNATLSKKDILLLPFSFNCQDIASLGKRNLNLINKNKYGYSAKEFKKAIVNPIVVHFVCAGRKPWKEPFSPQNKYCGNPSYLEWLNYAENTKFFADEIMEDFYTKYKNDVRTISIFENIFAYFKNPLEIEEKIKKINREESMAILERFYKNARFKRKKIKFIKTLLPLFCKCTGKN